MRLDRPANFASWMRWVEGNLRQHDRRIAKTGGATTATFLVGGMQPYAPAGAIPAGWLECDGRALTTTEVSTTYPDLAAALGTTYNISGDAGTVRRLPDLRM